MAKRKRKTPPAEPGDRIGPTRERLAKGDVRSDKVDDPENPRLSRIVMRSQKIVDYLRRRDLISKRAYEAASDFWTLWHKAGLSPSVTAPLAPLIAGQSDYDRLPVAQCDARRRLRSIIGALSPQAWKVVRHIVIDDNSASSLAKSWGFKTEARAGAAGVVAAQMALDALAWAMENV